MRLLVLLAVFLAASSVAFAANSPDFPYGGESACSEVEVYLERGEFQPWYCESDEDCEGCSGLGHGSYTGDFTACDSSRPSAYTGEHYSSCVKCTGDDRFQASGMGYGQGSCELACGSSEKCDEFKPGEQAGCGLGFACDGSCHCAEAASLDLADSGTGAADSDFDGVPDSDDLCPDTILLQPVDASGCSVAFDPGDPVDETTGDDLLAGVVWEVPPSDMFLDSAGVTKEPNYARISFKTKKPPRDASGKLFDWNPYQSAFIKTQLNWGDPAGSLFDKVSLLIVDENGNHVGFRDYAVTRPESVRKDVKGNWIYTFDIRFRPMDVQAGRKYFLAIESRLVVPFIRSKAGFFVNLPPGACEPVSSIPRNRRLTVLFGGEGLSKAVFDNYAENGVQAILAFEPFKSNSNSIAFIKYSRSEEIFQGIENQKGNSNLNKIRSLCPADIMMVISPRDFRSYAQMRLREAFVSIAYQMRARSNSDLGWAVRGTLVHEFGHMFWLGDEYGTGYNVREVSPNCAKSEQQAADWWSDLRGSDKGNPDLEISYHKGGCGDNVAAWNPTKRSIMYEIPLESERSFLSSSYGAVGQRCILKVLDAGGHCTEPAELKLRARNEQKTYTQKVREKDYVIR